MGSLFSKKSSQKEIGVQFLQIIEDDNASKQNLEENIDISSAAEDPERFKKTCDARGEAIEKEELSDLTQQEESVDVSDKLKVIFVGNNERAGQRLYIDGIDEKTQMSYVGYRIREFLCVSAVQLSLVAEFCQAMHLKVNKKEVKGDDADQIVEAVTGFLTSGISCVVLDCIQKDHIRVWINEKQKKFIDIQYKPQDTIHELKKKIQQEGQIEMQGKIVKYGRYTLSSNLTGQQCGIEEGDELRVIQDTIKQIYVKTPKGSLIPMDVDKQDTISTLKQQINQIENIPTQDQGLILDDQNLGNDQTITQCNIKDKSTIAMIIKQYEGMTLFVKTPLEKKLIFSIRKIDTVERLKQQIWNMEHIPIYQQMLYSPNGTKMEDSKRLSSFTDIGDNCTLNMTFIPIGQVHLSIKVPSGKVLDLEMEVGDTIERVKHTIQIREGIPLEKQKLCYLERNLNDKKTLQQLRIRGMSTLYVAIKQEGGMLIFVMTEYEYEQTLVFEVKKTDMIIVLKQKIRDMEHIPIEKIWLYSAGRRLEDDKTFEEYNIQEKTRLFLIIKQKTDGMLIFVKKPMGKIFGLEVDQKDTILDVKQQIELKENIEIKEQRLTLKGFLLEDDKTIQQYKIQNDQTLQLFMKQKDGLLIFIKAPEGQAVALEVQKNETIRNIKQKLMHQEEGTLTAEQLNTIYDGAQLDDQKKVSDYNIQNGATIHLAHQIHPFGRINIQFQKEEDNEKEKIENVGITVELTDTVEQLKNKIEKKMKISVLQQCLKYQGIELEDNNQTLQDLNIKFKDNLQLTLQPLYALQIFIQLLNNKTLILNVENMDAVESVKWKIEEIEKIQSDQFILLFGGKELKDDRSLQEYGIQNGSTLFMDVRLYGGQPPKLMVDVGNVDTIIKMEFSNYAPDWRIVNTGLSIEGECSDRKCPAFGHIVIYQANFVDFDIQSTVAECPKCHCEITPIKPGFYQCIWSIHFKKVDGKVTRIPWKKSDSKYTTYKQEDSGTAEFVKLIIHAKILDSARNKKDEDGKNESVAVPIAESCGLCHEKQEEKDSDVLLMKCDHSFHRKCVLGWIDRGLSCPHCDKALEWNEEANLMAQ
ncbi:MAG: putative Polyubiquitin [Streblomastix strix]|uniref:Putative Polyubiquitin n=1 Tax=Streblomastix strix TaxID=222440 RepID=A0A5J4V8H9_9EUKA|nr:MAG: putative Polyubiquitin [Streblomastix strix]